MSSCSFYSSSYFLLLFFLFFIFLSWLTTKNTGTTRVPYCSLIMDREECVFLAKVAEQAERYDGIYPSLFSFLVSVPLPLYLVILFFLVVLLFILTGRSIIFLCNHKRSAKRQATMISFSLSLPFFYSARNEILVRV